jgi:hypothetical protein
VVHGRIDKGTPLIIESRMPQNGVIFSDGVEEDFLAFNSGAVAMIAPASRTLRLVRPAQQRASRRAEGPARLGAERRNRDWRGDRTTGMPP